MGKNIRFIVLCSGMALSLSFWSLQENATPKVEIVSPLENTKVPWNTIVPYRIKITDREDGNSEYDEIKGNTVILTVALVPEATSVENDVSETVVTQAEGLSQMASANCLTCHNAKGKLIGPSFEEIANRYTNSPKNKAYLVNKVGTGSTGIWGDAIMPAQTELEKEAIGKMIDWILQNGRDTHYTFYTGLEGSFITNKKPKNASKAVYLLHAHYRDQGLTNGPGTSKMGSHSLLLRVE